MTSVGPRFDAGKILIDPSKVSAREMSHIIGFPTFRRVHEIMTTVKDDPLIIGDMFGKRGGGNEHSERMKDSGPIERISVIPGGRHTK